MDIPIIELPLLFKKTKTTNGAIEQIDEIKSYYDCRYISTCEACYRIFGFDIHYR